MIKIPTCLAFVIALAFALTALPAATARAESVAEFYAGKQIKLVVGFDPGGGYDLYARLLARHLPRHIPGTPSVVVQNMPGAGSVRAANFVYANAPKDGTVVASIQQNMPLFQLLGGKAAQFDAARFQWLGSITAGNSVIYTWHTSPVKTIDDARTKTVIMGSTGPNSDSHTYPVLLNNLLGTKFKIIDGYSGGSRELLLALERGEVEGRGGENWPILMVSARNLIDEKKLNLLVQIGFKPEPEIPNVPLLIDLVASADDKQVVTAATLPTALGYAYWMAPGVPADRVAAMQEAFDRASQDRNLLDEARAAGLLVRAQPGTEMDALIKQVAAMPSTSLSRAAKLLEWGN